MNGISYNWEGLRSVVYGKEVISQENEVQYAISCDQEGKQKVLFNAPFSLWGSSNFLGVNVRKYLWRNN